MASSMRLVLLLSVVAVSAAMISPRMMCRNSVPSLRLRGGADDAVAGGMPGMPAFPPGMNMDAMNTMFQNPAFQKMANSLMDNPAFKARMDEMMKNETMMKEYAKIGEQVLGSMGGSKEPTLGSIDGAGAGGAPGAGGMPDFSTLMSSLQGKAGSGDAAGAGVGAAGGLDQMTAAAQSMMKDFLQPEKLQNLASSEEMKELQENPKMQEIIKDVQANGPMSVLKYYSDPDAMQIFSKITKLLGLPEEFTKAGEQFSKLSGADAAAMARAAGGAPPGMGGAPPLMPDLTGGNTDADPFAFSGGANPATDVE